MDNDRLHRFIVCVCCAGALAVTVSTAAAQYRALLPVVPPPELPATGNVQTSPQMGFWEKKKLRDQIRSRYAVLARTEGLSETQRQELNDVAALLGL